MSYCLSLRSQNQGTRNHILIVRNEICMGIALEKQFSALPKRVTGVASPDPFEKTARIQRLPLFV